MNSRKILYISYDGMCEPLGQSQVLSYLSRVHFASYENYPSGSATLLLKISGESELFLKQKHHKKNTTCPSDQSNEVSVVVQLLNP